MSSSLIEADSLLAIDVGTLTTRAMLFDAVEGQYRFLAVGTSPSTMGSPYFDAGEGIHRAIEELQEISGRVFIDADEQLVIPATPDGLGVDAVVGTISAGEPLRVIAVGLLEDISLESARYLATTTYAKVVDTISMNDRRKTNERIDMIVAHRPDLIIVAGGTEHGASKSLLNLLDSVGLACYLLPKNVRPHILFAGNQDVAPDVEASLGEYAASINVAPNIRPVLEEEQLAPAKAHMRTILRDIYTSNNAGLRELDSWTRGRLTPGSTAFGRIIDFFSRYYASNKGALGIDVGAASTTVAASLAGDLKLYVYSQLGMGANLPDLLKYTDLDKIARWVPFDVSHNDLRDYIYFKTIYPASLPGTKEEFSLEQALARELIRTAMKGARRRLPKGLPQPKPGLLPWFEPIIATGSTISQAPSPGQSLLMLLDSLEPTGITKILLDQNNLLSVLGAVSEVNPTLTVQVIESGAFLNLGTVISPVGNAAHGTPVVRVKVRYENGEEQRVDVKQGSLEAVRLPEGQRGDVQLQPLHRYDVGMGPGHGGTIRGVPGGALGVVIDARGRPLSLPKENDRRQDAIKKWLWTLGS